MLNFTLQLPTKIIFGRDIEQDIGKELSALGAKRVLLHFGGGSVLRSGLLQKVEESLAGAGISFVRFGGARPNPIMEHVREGIAFCQQEQIDFILAVGGGSAIDSAKMIGIGYATGVDPWTFIETKTIPQKSTPLGTVLTLSATGSEMSNSAVISSGNFKRGITAQVNRPLISFLNPENTFTVSKFQTGCGIVDTLMHTLERYCTSDFDSDLTDSIAEGLLRSVIAAGRRAIANPNDYEARATLMWGSTLAHNGLTGCGKTHTFTVHKLEHDISGLFPEVAHGAGLAVLFPAWAEEVFPMDVRRFAALAHRVWGCPMDFDHPERTAKAGIDATRAYFKEIGMPTTLEEIGISPEDYDRIADMTTDGGKTSPISCYGELNKERILRIYRRASAKGLA